MDWTLTVDLKSGHLLSWILKCFFDMAYFIHRILSKFRDSFASAVHNRMYFDMCAHELQLRTLNSTIAGTTADCIAAEEIIVSLSTHGRRLYEVYLAIESIMQGSVKPNRIILWLSKSLEDTPLPFTVRCLISRGLEVYYVDDIGPYTKVVPAFLKFPNATIVTIDDDILYPYDALEMLLSAHLRYPRAICANRIMDIKLDKDANPTTLPSWQELLDRHRISRLNFFEGVGGVLYPPSCFDRETLDATLFLRLCLTADDVWFNVQALRQEISVVPANYHYNRFPLLINEKVQDVALWRINNNPSDTLNDLQFSSVLKYYHLSYGE